MNPPTHNQPPEKPPGFKDCHPPFASKRLALDAGYTVRPVVKGGFSVFYGEKVTTMHDKSERGAWAIIVRAQ